MKVLVEYQSIENLEEDIYYSTNIVATGSEEELIAIRDYLIEQNKIAKKLIIEARAINDAFETYYDRNAKYEYPDDDNDQLVKLWEEEKLKLNKLYFSKNPIPQYLLNCFITDQGPYISIKDSDIFEISYKIKTFEDMVVEPWSKSFIIRNGQVN